MLPIVVPSLTLCTRARVSVPPAAYVNRFELPLALLGQRELPAAEVRDALGVVERAAASAIELISAPVLLTCTTDVASSPTTNSVSVPQS